MGKNRYPLLSQRHVLDVGEVFLVAFLNGSQQQETVTVRGEQRMRLRVQPLSLRCPFRMSLLALP